MVVTAVVLLAACAGGDSVGSLRGDQGAATGLTRRAVCARYDRIVGDRSLSAAETTDRLEALADETATHALAEQIRAAADSAGSAGGSPGARRRPSGCRDA